MESVGYYTSLSYFQKIDYGAIFGRKRMGGGRAKQKEKGHTKNQKEGTIS